MKHTSFLHKFTAAFLSCTLCSAGMTVPAFSAEEAEELPERFDYREEAPELLTPVKNQVGGTCWAYSALGCIESTLIKKGMADSSIDLSESALVWFTLGQGSPTDPDDPRYGGGIENGDKAYTDGAHIIIELASLSSWQGVASESDVTPISELPALDESLRYQAAAHVQNVRYYSQQTRDMEFTKQLLMDNGPLRVVYYQSYRHPLSEKGGYYNPNHAEEMKAGVESGGSHAAMLIGWDDHYAKENFTTEPPGDGAWIIRNSWGNYQNSDNGYFYMSYYEPTFGQISFYDCEPVTNYGSQYNYSCTAIATKPLPSTQYGYYTANVFEAQKPEKISAVGFQIFHYFPDPMPYEISVYLLDPEPDGPQDGKLVSQVKDTLEFSGYYTVKLPESIAVEKGQKYSVVMKTPTGTMCFFDKAGYKEGVSYYAYYTADEEEPLSWTDCYGTEFGDVCLHVYTEYEGETEPLIRGDLNRDGRVNAVDLSLLKQLLLGSDRTDIDRKAADWNGDGNPDAEDAQGLLDFLLQKPGQDETKIRLTGKTADKRDAAFRRQMQDAVTARVPDFDFSQFSFETQGFTYLHEKNDATAEIGKQYDFRICYQDYLLDPEHYTMHIRQYYDGRFETDADFLTPGIQEKLAEAAAAPRIAQADAVSTARAYAASLEIPDLPGTLYQPSERFGEAPVLLVYSPEEGKLAYRVSDPLFNGYTLGTGQSKILCGAAADVYVDAATGEVLENRFMTTKSVS